MIVMIHSCRLVEEDYPGLVVEDLKDKEKVKKIIESIPLQDREWYKKYYEINM